MTAADDYDSPARPTQRVPIDLFVVLLVAGGVLASATLRIGPSPLRVLLGFLFVFVVPGYAITSALFPQSRATVRIPVSTDRSVDSLTDGQRLVLSVALSLFTTPLVTVALGIAGYLDAASVLTTLALVSTVFVVVAGGRRARLPASARYAAPGTAWLADGLTRLRNPTSGTDAVLNVLILVGLLVGTVSVAFAVGFPGQGESFVAFGVLAADPVTGEPIADQYPETLTVGEPETLYFEVENRGDRPAEFTVVVLLQRVNDGGAVTETESLDRFDRQVAPGETWLEEHQVSPTMTGSELRLTYLLYEGSVPERPRRSNADRSAHIWVDVTG